MVDPTRQEPASSTAEPPIAETITRALGSIWRDHASERPSDISTVIDHDVVKCVMKDAVASFDAGPTAVDGVDPDSRASNVSGYRQQAIAAVARATKRRVIGFIPKHDKKTDVATETFILDGAPAQR